MFDNTVAREAFGGVQMSYRSGATWLRVSASRGSAQIVGYSSYKFFFLILILFIFHITPDMLRYFVNS